MVRIRQGALVVVAVLATAAVALPGVGGSLSRVATGLAGDGEAVVPARPSAGLDALAPSFEANRGQAGPGVGFVSRAGGMSLSLSPTQAFLALSGPKGPARLGMHLVGADPAATQVGRQRLGATVNHYTGTDQAKWLSDIPTYARVATIDAYPGIDLVWHSHPGALEYDFVVAPGADPARIALGFTGATGLGLDRGDLVVGLPGGSEVRQRAPRLYQDLAGRRRAVAGRFVVHDDQVGFAVGAYDHSRPLVIDPVLAYSTYLGRGGDDRAADVAVDGAGNVYVAGVGEIPWVSWNPLGVVGPPARTGAALAYHPATAKAVLFGGRGQSGALLSDTWLFDAVSSTWAKLDVPAPPARAFAGIATEADAARRVVLFGGQGGAGVLSDTWVFDGSQWLQMVPLPAGGAIPPGRSWPAMAGFEAGVVLFGGRGTSGLLGDTWVWNGLDWLEVAAPGSPSARAEAAVATDAAGAVHLFGGKGAAGELSDTWVWSGAWRPADAASIAVPPSRRGAALVREHTGGLRLVGGRAGTNLLKDRWVYVGGQWTAADQARPAPGPLVGAATAYHEAAASALVVGGEGPKAILSEATWALDPTPPPPTPPPPPAFGLTKPPNTWVAKFSPGGALRYVTYLSADIDVLAAEDITLRLAVDATGTAYVGGSTTSFDLPTTPGAYQPACRPTFNSGGVLGPECEDAFVAVLGPGGGLRYATYIGGEREEQVYGVGVGPGGTVYLAGRASSRDFPTTPGAYQTVCTATSVFGGVPFCGHAFLAKIAPSGSGAADLVYSTFFGGRTGERATDLAVDGEGVAHLTGEARSVDMPTTPGAYQRTCFLEREDLDFCRDAFVVKLAPAGQGAADLRYSTFVGGGCCYGPGPAQGGGGSDTANGIALGPKGSIYVTGMTGSSDFPITPGAFDKTLTCASDFGCKGFLFKLTPKGLGSADLRYATYLGGGAGDYLTDVAVDGAGRAVVVGMSLSATFPLRHPVQKTCGCATGTPKYDVVVAKLDPTVKGDGSGRWSPTNQALLFSSFLGGGNELPVGSEEIAPNVGLDVANSIWVAGTTQASNFPTTPDAFQPDRPTTRDNDGFASKITGVP